MSGEDDGGFSALAPSVQRKIDDAFDSAVLSSSPSTASRPPSKRRKLDHDLSSFRPPSTPSVSRPDIASNHPRPGGFLLDDPSTGGFVRDSPPPGGFLPEQSLHSDPYQDNVPTHIPLSLIPAALQILNLQPDDDDVLSVFRNAASGWDHRSTSDHPQDGLVGRRDWRAVCAALLDPGLARDDADVDDTLSSPSDTLAANIDVDEASDSGEEYLESDSNMGDDQDSDDDYHEGGFLRSERPAGKTASKVVSQTSRGRARKASVISSEDGSEIDEAEAGLSAQKKKECRTAFALFFPDARDEALDKARISIKDISRVATLIKERLSTEEVVEMLEAFSSSPDKSMGLEDFERMMVTAKMV
ncbi:hypothetical protein V8D89_016113 [Ganoderma adspersum]